MRYVVWNIDAWRHAPSECKDYGCPCVSECDCKYDDDRCNAEHDDDRCQCHYETNDRSRVGSIALSSDKEADDVNLLGALIADGFLKSHVTLSDVEFDDPSCMGENIYVQDAKTGEPLLQLEAVANADEIDG